MSADQKVIKVVGINRKGILLIKIGTSGKVIQLKVGIKVVKDAVQDFHTKLNYYKT